jgi:hypothetical protein
MRAAALSPASVNAPSAGRHCARIASSPRSSALRAPQPMTPAAKSKGDIRGMKALGGSRRLQNSTFTEPRKVRGAPGMKFASPPEEV